MKKFAITWAKGFQSFQLAKNREEIIMSMGWEIRSVINIQEVK